MSVRTEILSDSVTLYCGDCREILPTLGKVDAVVTDPPYGIGENAKKVASRGTSSAKWKKATPTDYGEFEWDTKPIDAATMVLVRGAAKWQIIFGGNYYEMPASSCWLVWDKLNSGDFADCELAWTNLHKAVRRIQWTWNGFQRKGGEPRFHPTQKPTGVMKWCIEQLPDDVQIILDPFMGSGTTGVAAAKLGRRFIGIEKHEPYFDISIRRIQAALDAPSLFDEPKPPAPQQEKLTL